MTAIRPAAPPRALPVRTVGALLGASATGTAAGALTAYLQGVLSGAWNTVANSGAVWTIAAFLVALALGRQRGVAMATGTLVLVGEVAGYYAWVADVRHIPVLHAAELLWTIAALWIGPLTGAAAHLARAGSADERVIAALAVWGVAAGEGIYLWRLAGIAWSGQVELAIGLTGALLTMILVPACWSARGLAAGAGGLVALGVYAAYSAPLFA